MHICGRWIKCKNKCLSKLRPSDLLSGYFFFSKAHLFFEDWALVQDCHAPRPRKVLPVDVVKTRTIGQSSSVSDASKLKETLFYVCSHTIYTQQILLLMQCKTLRIKTFSWVMNAPPLDLHRLFLSYTVEPVLATTWQKRPPENCGHTISVPSIRGFKCTECVIENATIWEMRIADTEGRPKASIQPAKSDHMRQIAAKNTFLIA